MRLHPSTARRLAVDLIAELEDVDKRRMHCESYWVGRCVTALELLVDSTAPQAAPVDRVDTITRFAFGVNP